MIPRTLIAAFLAALAIAPAAAAGNWPASNLDAAASDVAGHPVSVWCESSWGDWIHFGDSFDEDLSFVMGFTSLTFGPVIFVNPAICETLHALRGAENVGTYHASIAILTLAHEAVHQRGVTDEGETDCTALPLVRGLAVRYFGITEQISVPKTVTRTKLVARQVSGKTVQVKVAYQTVIRVTVSNPWLDRLVADSLRWHRSAPLEYQGNC